VVQGMAVVDRINFEHLPNEDPQADVLSLPNITWLPSKEEHQVIRETLKVLIQRTLCEQMVFFKENFEDLVIYHIEHDYLKESTLKSEVVSFVFCGFNTDCGLILTNTDSNRAVFVHHRYH